MEHLAKMGSNIHLYLQRQNLFNFLFNTLFKVDGYNS